ncbi:hypothetical protein CkaCkLH20_04858 [Colletotrichum karsti]|uniref:ACB domain-containing protein n=1 Tax=Colletotrichum karsti TaxID=1095194 RepID=A0A9P6LLF9_9PEZI|nr:uncharacterized protein CkaCkLH20_04858 [Colletotrichum karsti]KAF9877723.1 hypothetical protein CkaCkLH20_04858 [Colletotrichum karsti]
MEGDVDGVMERPTSASGMPADELQREKDKWDAWNSQTGLTRTEAKRRYIEALIETMHKYATTPDAKELVAELEFVWNQIKNNSPSSTDSSPKGTGYNSEPRRFTQPLSGSEGPMKILSPMSEDDAAERDSDRRLGYNEGVEEDALVPNSNWSRSVERALEKMSAEVAALREQITTGREWKSRKQRSFMAWVRWFVWIVMKHLAIDTVLLAFILLWMRKRKDRRLEDLDGNGATGSDAPMNKSGSLTPTAKNSQEEEEDIPTFQAGCQSMAMFVPLEESLFEPFEEPKTKLDRLKASVENVDKQAAGVQENIRYIYERERRRIVRLANKLEAANGLVETDLGIAPDDRAIMMAYVEAAFPPGADFSTRTQSTYTIPEKPPTTGLPPRQGAILWSLYNTGQALIQMCGYMDLAQKFLDEYHKEIEEETAALEAQKVAWTG